MTSKLSLMAGGAGAGGSVGSGTTSAGLGLGAGAEAKTGFLSSLMDNPIFGAGVGVAGLGIGFSVLRRAAMSGILLAQRYFTTSLEIPSKDRSYHWVLQWINQSSKGRTQHIGVETRVVFHDNGTHTTHFDFVPSPGRHYIWFQKHLIQVEREREKSVVDLNSGTPWETVKLTLFGRDSTVFTKLLEEAKLAAMKRDEGKTIIYMPMMTDWRPFGRPRARRPLNSVFLDAGISERLVQDVQEFHRTASWYSQRGIPHRRGYLLYGPPGGGKSSFIQALAGELGHNICVLNLNDRGLTDDRLLHLMTEVPPRSIILLEDIDAVFNNRESTYTVTFSGLLNALDGVTSAEERLVFMTTNHIEKLDSALIRPGRVDVQQYIGYSTPHQQRCMFMQFYPDFDPSMTGENTPQPLEDEVTTPFAQFATDLMTRFPLTKPLVKKLGIAAEESEQTEGQVISTARHQKPVSESAALADLFVAQLEGVNISMAELQGLMMLHKNQPRAAVVAAGELRLRKLQNNAKE